MKAKIRRINPLGGVSRPMIEAEAKYVQREAASYLRSSLNELKEKLAERSRQWRASDESLHALVLGLGERERLAVMCMLVRDQTVLLELYAESVRGMAKEEIPPLGPSQIPRSPFSEWLFAPEAKK